MMKFLVIGTGRSGTGFMSELLTINGERCGHESVYGVPVDFNKYQANEKNTNYAGDSSWLAVPFIPKILENNPNIKFIHIVRNPIDVVKSFVELGFFGDVNLDKSPYVRLIGRYADLNNKSQLERAIEYYITWLRMIESFKIENKIVVQLENMNYDLLSKTLGHEIKPLDTVVNAKKDEKIISLKREVIEKEIKNSPMFLELEDIAKKKYGYEL